MKKIPYALTILGCVISLSVVAESKSSDEKRGWISIGSDAANTLQKSYASSVPVKRFETQSKGNNTISILEVPLSSLDDISEIMHEEHNRCGGYFFHESFEEAQDYVRSIENIKPLLVDYTIDQADAVAALFSKLSASNLAATVSNLSSYNNRYYTQQSGVDAANWIRDTWDAIGSQRTDISVELFEHSWAQPSVIATVTGTRFPDEIVIVGGHLDSINGSNPSSARAPGADDNASGISVATETLRAMVAAGFRPARTVKFMAYAAEEVGLRGSRAIAEQFKARGENVIGVAQFDMTGRKGTANRDIVFMTDFTSEAQNQFMADVIDTYMSDLVYGFSRCGYGCSDHASWHNEGYPASIPFESNFNDSNPSIHSSNDTAFDADHAFKFAKLSAAYVAELAKSDAGPTTPTPTPTTPPPNPGCSEDALDLRRVSAYGGNNTGSASPTSDGCGIALTGNVWRISDIGVEVDADTQVSFDFQTSGGSAEIQGIGFDADTTASADRIFQLAGTQNWGIRDFSYTGNGEKQRITIPIGQYYTGNNLGFVISNDKDSGAPDNAIVVSNVVISSSNGSPACTVSESFESGNGGWQNASGSSCTTGAFVVGTPSQQSDGGVTTQVGSAASGSAAFYTGANSTAGTDDVDGGNCVASSPEYSVARASSLSVSYFHGQRDSGDDSADFFRIEMSTDGGSSFSTLASNGDSASNASWQSVSAAVPAGSTVVLRAQCSDGVNEGDLVECGIDDVSICPN